MSSKKENPPQNASAARPVIYAVDDEVMILEMITFVLEPLGYQVQTFRDPELALQSFASHPNRPVLVITDYAMHTMNGMEFIEKCRTLTPDQRVLLASGTVGEEIFANALTKPDRFLAKPFKPHELTAVVRELIGH